MSVDFGNSLTRDQVDGPGDDPAQARAQLDAIISRLNNKLVNVTILTAADKTGNDAGIVSGTAGTDGNLVQWNADGDAVDGPDVLSAISSGSDTDVVSKAALQGSGVAALVPIGQVTASDNQYADISSGIDGTYDVYVLIAEGVRPGTNGDTLVMETSSDGGSSYDNSGGQYQWVLNTINTAGNDSVNNNGSAQFINIARSVGGGASDTLSFSMHLRNPSNSNRWSKVEWDGSYIDDSDNGRLLKGYAARTENAVVNAIRFSFSSSNITAGTFRLYGIKNS